MDYLVKVSKCSKSLMQTELPINISVSLPVVFDAEGHPAGGQIRCLRPALNEPKYPKFRSGTRRPTVSERVG